MGGIRRIRVEGHRLVLLEGMQADAAIGRGQLLFLRLAGLLDNANRYQRVPPAFRERERNFQRLAGMTSDNRRRGDAMVPSGALEQRLA